jgi:lipoprotein-anchoring transpeptidase ErfK/SrfK
MQRLVLPTILAVIAFNTASAGPLNLNPPGLPAGDASAFAQSFARPPVAPTPVQQNPNYGGGFFEMLFRGPAASRYEPNPIVTPQYDQRGYRQPFDPAGESPAHPAVSQRFMKQVVNYDGSEKPGTVIINTNERLLYLVQEDGRAVRYGIGVGRPGFTWAGVRQISRKREWPDWTPPPEMLKRRPDLPRHMEGGPENPLGARAMYLGSSLYRIHGSNEPWTIGQAVSSGCIRMRNEDVIDLYDKVKVGTKVVVI